MSRINHWTTQELELLVKHYPTSTRNDMRAILPYRTYDSIKQKSRALGLKKRFREEGAEALDKNQRRIESGVITRTGNLTIHRML